LSSTGKAFSTMPIGLDVVWHTLKLNCAFACLLLASATGFADNVATIERVKPSVVGVGTYQKTRTPAFQFMGTGFVVGDGSRLATNGHVLPPILNSEQREILAIAIPGAGSEAQLREARIIAVDRQYDLAVLGFDGGKLPAVALGESAVVREGQTYLFTGFPLGTVLGLYPVTHRAMVSAVSPVAIPSARADQLDPKLLKRLTGGAFSIFQLDATAYPGNSGSPLYDPESGEVVAVINMVFVKGTKETALTQPSGITYAIPIRFLRELLDSRK
jgi:serine protease Do